MAYEFHSIGREKAIELGESRWWELCSNEEIAKFQFFTRELCMPFDRFHEAMEKTLGRPIFTHEFGVNKDGIAAELMGEGSAPTMEEIINMIPEEKRIIIRR